MNTVDIEAIKAERQTLLNQLKQLTDEQWAVSNKMQSVKDKIRKNNEAYIKQYADKFKPGTVWCIENNCYNEYFKVAEVDFDGYTYREDDINNCIIDIYGEYIRILNPNSPDCVGNINTQYKSKETVYVKVGEIDDIKEISSEDWSKAIQMLAKTAMYD